MIDENPYFSTELGSAYLGDSLVLLPKIKPRSIDLICTSPPFALKRKKSYGNVPAREYVPWFMQFAEEFRRILRPKGSLVIDIGGTWTEGYPIRSLYQFELVIELCKPVEEGGGGFELAQEFYWYNPAKLPTPAEWVTVRRERAKDAVNTIWWLSLDKHPKANNRRVLKPYSDSQRKLMENGYKPKTRPSEHVISKKFGKDNKGAIPPNIIIAANTSSNDPYLRACRIHNVKPHPARFPPNIPEFFIGLCTEEGDIVLDPFAGSNMTGYIAEKMGRRWIAIESEEEYFIGAKFRFDYDTESIAALEREKELKKRKKEQIQLDQLEVETIG